ncbi:MAG: hypothetical protein EA404_00500 [Spirochaetaceae bacterium]|nr:MAG: hypothetical protein EA404_00500 [Spirochaetaceae bacterium]
MTALLRRMLLKVMIEPNGQPDELSEIESDHATRGISSDEQADIQAEIEKAFLVQREAHDETRFRYTPLRRGALLPLLINLGALVLTAAAVLFLIALFERDERALAEVSAVGQTAQARLLEQFRADADAQLLQSEREIEQIRAELEQLRVQVPADQRDQATADRVAALEAELERALDQERVLLREVDSAETLSRLQRLQQQEELLAAQLSAALTRIGELEAELEQQPEPLTPEPTVIRELPEDDVAELQQLRATVQQLEGEVERLSGERDELAAQHASLASRQTQLTAERDRLQAAMTRLQTTVSQLERDLTAARSTEQQRAALRARLDSVSGALDDARTAAAPGREELLGKVETKVEVLRILSTEPIRSRHPGLDRQLEDYLDTLAAESRREGRIGGLQEAVALLQRVSGSGPATADLEGRFAAAERAVVRDILQQLQQLLR